MCTWLSNADEVPCDQLYVMTAEAGVGQLARTGMLKKMKMRMTMRRMKIKMTMISRMTMTRTVLLMHHHHVVLTSKATGPPAVKLLKLLYASWNLVYQQRSCALHTICPTTAADGCVEVLSGRSQGFIAAKYLQTAM